MVLKRRLLIGITSVLTMAACTPRIDNSFNANNKDTNHIVGGTLVKSSDAVAKSIVGLYVKNLQTGSIETCTGSLLTNNMVVTAAHCASDLDGKVDIFVIFTTTVEDSKFAKKDVRKVDLKAVVKTWGTKLKPDDVNTGDVALLHYKGSTPSGYVSAVLAYDDSYLTQGDELVVAGYGATKVIKTPIDVNIYPDLIGKLQEGTVACENNIELKNCYEISMEGNGQLRKTTVTIADPIYSLSEISVNQDRGTGFCHGDSGGPAYVMRGNRYYLVGILSRTINDPFSECTHQAVFTSVPYYLRWLNQAGEMLLAEVQKNSKK